MVRRLVIAALVVVGYVLWLLDRDDPFWHTARVVALGEDEYASEFRRT